MQNSYAPTPRFARAAANSSPLPGRSWRFLFVHSNLLIDAMTGTIPLLDNEQADQHGFGEQSDRPLIIGRYDGFPCHVARLTTADGPKGFIALGLRELYGRVPDELWHVAALASQLLYWDDTTQFCSHCGARTVTVSHEWAKSCPSCEHVHYPRLNPVIIVLVHDGDRFLLGRQPAWPAGRYSLIAGFVEAGESLEECVTREVREETGIRVADITYVGSQSWPFPHQLMTGFLARYAGGDISIDRHELQDARWFTRDNLPQLPPPPSIARAIIDRFIAAGYPLKEG